MSVIFKTLKKLRGSGQGAKKKRSALRRYGNIYSFRRILLSPLGVFSGAVLLIIAGLVASYAADVLRNYFPHNNEAPVLAEAETTPTPLAGIDGSLEDETLGTNEAIQQESETSRENRQNEDLPKLSTDGVVEELKPQTRRLPLSHPKKPDPPETRSTKYLPPKSETRPEMPSAEIERTARQPSLLPVGEQVSTGHEPGEGGSDSREGGMSMAERIHLANVREARKINRLVSKIKGSITQGHMDDAKAHIDELAVLKGDQDSYVLKLRAFWHMRQGNFEASAPFLTAVLAKEKDDLEAGINMAIVEIKTHRLDKARKRLAELREIYPANPFIEEIIQKIGR